MEKAQDQIGAANAEAESSPLPEWIKPSITGYEPVKAAEGISYLPLDGLQNLSP